MEFAKSMSGHDRNQYYLILKKEEDAVYLVNGTTRTLEKPKKKNQKHIQIVKKLPEEVNEILKDGITDNTIKRAIKVYEKIIIANA